MHMFMGLLSRMFNVMVASSSPVGGSGTLQQSCVALSIAEAEYVIACSASCEAVRLWKLMSDIFDLQMDVTCIHCDN